MQESGIFLSALYIFGQSATVPLPGMLCLLLACLPYDN